MRRVASTAALAFASVILAGTSMAQVPEPPPPTCVPTPGVPCPGYDVPAAEQVCKRYKTITVEYVCGTEEREIVVQVLDPATNQYVERTEVVLVEKKCTKSEDTCEEWGPP
jgi:hypothetical protein